jgi:hypothetical protein
MACLAPNAGMLRRSIRIVSAMYCRDAKVRLFASAGKCPAPTAPWPLCIWHPYVRTHFGNRYTDSITAAEVATLDQSLH